MEWNDLASSLLGPSICTIRIAPKDDEQPKSSVRTTAARAGGAASDDSSSAQATPTVCDTECTSIDPESSARFQLVRRLGKGGFGVVFLAVDQKLHRQVALKVPRSDILLTKSIVNRLMREALNAAKLDHPNIIRFWRPTIRWVFRRLSTTTATVPRFHNGDELNAIPFRVERSPASGCIWPRRFNMRIAAEFCIAI